MDNGEPDLGESDFEEKHRLAKDEEINTELELYNVKQPRMTKLNIIKNLTILSVSFLFLFTAFQSLQNLQSSLNKEEGLGTVSLSVIYISSVIAGLLLPPFVINHLGCKWTLAASMVCYVVYMAANMYAIWGTMIPASVIIGIGAAPLWAAKCTYLTQIAVWYAKITEATKDVIINLFFGVFFMTFQTSQVWGNLISSLIFKRIPGNLTDDVITTCGAQYCPYSYENNTNLDRPSTTKVYTLCGIYLGSACMAVAMIVAFLDKIVLDSDEERNSNGRKRRTGLSLSLMTNIFRHFWNSRYMKLLIPLTVYSGLEQAFVAGEFTRSYISCSVGIWNVGFVMIAYGAVDAMCSLLFGRLVKFVGHIPLFVLAFLVHGGSQISLLLWLPSPSDIHLLYLFAVLWGMGDAVVQTQINALFGYLFTDKPETAFASYRLCESVGFIIAFGYSSYLCTSVKMYVTMCFLTVGMVLYGLVEVLHRRGFRDK